jgi:hypothetical protein
VDQVCRGQASRQAGKQVVQGVQYGMPMPGTTAVRPPQEAGDGNGELQPINFMPFGVMGASEIACWLLLVLRRSRQGTSLDARCPLCISCTPANHKQTTLLLIQAEYAVEAQRSSASSYCRSILPEFADIKALSRCERHGQMQVDWLSAKGAEVARVA